LGGRRGHVGGLLLTQPVYYPVTYTPIYDARESEPHAVSGADEYPPPSGAAGPDEDRQAADRAEHADSDSVTVGLRLLKQRQYRRAADTLLGAVLANPEAGRPKLAFADALFGAGDFDYAAYAVRRGLDRVPDIRAAVAEQRDHFADVAELDRLIYKLHDHGRRNPKDGDGHLLAGFYLMTVGRQREAIESFDRAIKADPADRHASSLRRITMAGE